ncbi:glycogen synthase [Oleiharenicola lentus]|uniref:Glycogen synthase n=1 Tax=Oleiharenicola lentus TaxID=2508720 RepID=A0A4Q1CC93_9BACT|nr:glycogen synthase [Oleiharenicola lentus]RXK56668.1 glycogen synthase [Oleiharenicola lentus]
MRIAHAASEVFPYLKTGGLADMVAALGGTLVDRGHEVAVFMPGYRSVFDGPHAKGAELTHRLKIEMGDAFLAGDVYTLKPRAGLTLHLICREEYFDRRLPYWTGERDYDDNDARFIFFQKAVAELLRLTDFKADIVHCHDWQAGLLPLFLRYAEQRYGVTLALKTVFTIHNIAYQGIFPRKSFPLTNLPDELMGIDGLEYYDQMCMMKGGIVFADLVTTVSPRYAQEIQTPEFGNGMDGIIGTRVADLHGLINGIDTAVWNPATDASLPARFSVENMAGKALCREKLLQEFGWAPKPPSRRRTGNTNPPMPVAGAANGGFTGPVFGMVCRFTPSKGLDLLLGAEDFFAKENCRLVMLGGGEKKYEEALRALAARHPDKIGVCVKHDEAMSHLVEAGSDFFLMPSLFEPCGLNQMYSQAYGTVPLVSRVGGLVDTVVDIDVEPAAGTGIMFPPTQEAFNSGLRRALVLYADKAKYAEVQRRAMRRDFSWKTAVAAYEELYANAL